MDTTTKCQHFLVIGGLALLLIILACVAFLSPVQDVTTNNVEPVTRVVTYPTGMYDDDDRRNTRTTPKHNTRHTQPHSTRSTRTTSDNDDDSNNGRMNGDNGRMDDNMKETSGAQAHIQDAQKHNAVTGKPHAGSSNKKMDVPVAAVYPAAGAAGAGAAPHNRTKRSSTGMNGQSSSKSQMMGQMQMQRNMSMPPHKQMMVVGMLSGLTPGQIYAISMHQYGNMQNGCGKMGPAFNDMSQTNQMQSQQSQQSRKKRSLFVALTDDDALERVKRSKGISKNEQKKIRSYKEDHNGTLIGFAQANETGYANVSMMVPDQHQGACQTCGGPMGRGVTVRPVSGIPSKSSGAMSAGGMASGASSKNSEQMAEQFAKMIEEGQRKKRSSSSDNYQHQQSGSGSSMNGYQHKKKGQNNMMGGQNSNKGSSQAMFTDGNVPMMNQMATNGTLNGTSMYGYMDSPVACGVFGRGQSSGNSM